MLSKPDATVAYEGGVAVGVSAEGETARAKLVVGDPSYFPDKVQKASRVSGPLPVASTWCVLSEPHWRKGHGQNQSWQSGSLRDKAERSGPERQIPAGLMNASQPQHRACSEEPRNTCLRTAGREGRMHSEPPHPQHKQRALGPDHSPAEAGALL